MNKKKWNPAKGGGLKYLFSVQLKPEEYPFLNHISGMK